ncbi:MAG: PaaI family thioesterase [Spirochaetes bacterium]|nr:PaaI family thioesterase [Spirochaetota bacterium]
MRKEIQNPYSDNNCFFCGSENRIGLKLKFYWDEEKKEASTEYLPAQHFVGLGNILHGAIQMGILDEIMGWTSYVFTKEMGVTSVVSFKFLKPTYIGSGKISVTCRVISKEGSKVNMQATLSNNKNEACTTAAGTYHILPANQYNDLIHRK